MKKIRIKVIVEYEYEPNKEYYPEGSTIEEILAIDIEETKHCPYLFIDSEDAKFSFHGEIVNS